MEQTNKTKHREELENKKMYLNNLIDDNDLGEHKNLYNEGCPDEDLEDYIEYLEKLLNANGISYGYIYEDEIKALTETKPLYIYFNTEDFNDSGLRVINYDFDSIREDFDDYIKKLEESDGFLILERKRDSCYVVRETNMSDGNDLIHIWRSVEEAKESGRFDWLYENCEDELTEEQFAEINTIEELVEKGLYFEIKEIR